MFQPQMAEADKQFNGLIFDRRRAIRRCVAGLIAPNNFASQRQISNCSLGYSIKCKYRLTETRSFCQSYVAGNAGAINTITEMLKQLRRYVVSQTVARIVHGA